MGCGASRAPVRQVTVHSVTQENTEQTSHNSSGTASRLPTSHESHNTQTSQSHDAVSTARSERLPSTGTSSHANHDVESRIQNVASYDKLQDELMRLKAAVNQLTSEKEALEAHVAKVEGQFDRQQQTSVRLREELLNLQQVMDSGTNVHNVVNCQLKVSAGSSS